MRILALSRRLPPEGGRPGERAWRVARRLAAMEGAQVVWLAPCGKPWGRRVLSGPTRDVAVDIRYVAAGPWPWLEALTFLPGLVREGGKVVGEAELLLLPRGARWRAAPRGGRGRGAARAPLP